MESQLTTTVKTTSGSVVEAFPHSLLMNFSGLENRTEITYGISICSKSYIPKLWGPTKIFRALVYCF